MIDTVKNRWDDVAKKLIYFKEKKLSHFHVSH